MLKNGDMLVKKNLILVILDSRRIFMLGLPFDDSNFFKNFEYFFSSKILFFQKNRNFHVQDEKFPFPGYSESAFITDRVFTVLRMITWVD